MNEHDLEPLPPEVESLLAAERDRPGFTEAEVGRILRRLDNSIAVLPALASRQGPWWSRRGPFGLATFVLGLLLGAGSVARLHRPSPAPPSPVPAVASPPAVPELPATAPPPNAPEPVAPPPPPPLDQAPSPAPRASASEPAHPATSARSDDRDLDLGAERALLDAARAGIARGQTAAALEVLARHAQRFPNGRLSEERESMWVEALVQAGRYDEARQRAARFERAYPHSMLLPVVQAAVRSIP